MVHHVQGRQVGELLTAQEEEGVDEVDELGEEVPPGHVGGIEPVLGVGVVDRLTEPAVLPWQVTDIQSHCQLVLSTFQSHFHLDQFLGQFGENGEVKFSSLNINPSLLTRTCRPSGISRH